MAEIEYSKLVKKVYALLKRKGIHNDAENYINESYVILSQEGNVINTESIFKKAVSLIIGESFNGVYNTKATTKVCNCCKEDLPIAMFCQKWVKRLSRHITDYICKICKNKKGKQWVKKNLSKYKVWSQQYRDRLPDSYIIINLRKQGIENPTRDQILKNRRQLIQKRSKLPERFCSTTA